MAKDEDPEPKASRSAAGSKAAGNGASSQQTGGVEGAGATSAVEALKADHRKVEGLFERFTTAKDSEKIQVIEQICEELIVHSTIEEEIFYPACRQAAGAKLLDEAQVEHDCAKVLIVQLLDSRGDAFRDAKVKVLAEEIRAHIREEEAPGGLMAKAQNAGVDTPQLAARLARRKQDLLARLAEHAAPVQMPTFGRFFNPARRQAPSTPREHA